MSWRNILTKIPLRYDLTDCCEFGVYSGQSLIDIGNALNSIHRPVRKFFAFDSFQGFPKETQEEISQECWKEGSFSALEHFNSSNVQDCIAKTDQFVKQGCQLNTDWIYVPGFYEDVLVDDIVKQYDMQPFFYVDCDADLYSSTYTLLDFLLRNNLIICGTIIGFDNFGGSKTWETFSSGESRALSEIVRKYDLNIELLYQWGNCYPHVQRIYRVNAVKEQ